MTNLKYGAVAWDDPSSTYSKPTFGGKKESNWLKLESGNNKMRIITDPHQFYYHKFKVPGSKGYGDKVFCSGDKDSCPLCAEAAVELSKIKGSSQEAKDERKAKRTALSAHMGWFIGVIDRKTQQYKVLEIGPGVKKDLKGLNEDEGWGDLSTYDVNIKVNKQGGPTGYYSVLPQGKSPLSQEDIAITDKLPEHLAELAKKCVPPTKEGVEARIESIRRWRAKQAGTAANADETSPEAAADEASDDMNFSNSEAN